MGGSRDGMTYIPEDMQAMWEGGETQRFHTCMTLRPDTVGQHSFGVACVIMHVWPDAPAKVLRAALKHDMAESYTGDLPAPSKRALGIREQFAEFEDEYLGSVGIIPENLSPVQAWVLKFADSVDGLRVTIRERAMGNQMIQVANRNFTNYVDELLKNIPEHVPNDMFGRCSTLAWALKEEWEIVNR